MKQRLTRLQMIEGHAQRVPGLLEELKKGIEESDWYSIAVKSLEIKQAAADINWVVNNMEEDKSNGTN